MTQQYDQIELRDRQFAEQNGDMVLDYQEDVLQAAANTYILPIQFQLYDATAYPPITSFNLPMLLMSADGDEESKIVDAFVCIME